jgi:ParB family transcriptional regulator, chromosome partitioning protein
MEARRRALGRGLGALIPMDSYRGEPGADDGAERTVPIDRIVPNAYQPRGAFSESSLNELASSIRDKGLLQPLLVKRTSDGYEIIAGERRFRAARRAGLERIPVIVREADACESLELALVENLQREDLNPLEEAQAYQRLVDEFGFTQEDIAKRVGKNRSTVTNSLRLLQLPDEIRIQVGAGTLSAGHARSLLALGSPAQQVGIAREISRRKLSVRDTERLVRERANRGDADLDRQSVETELTQALGTRVRLKQRKNGAGSIEIEYYSLAELNGLVSRLAGTNGLPQTF